MKIGKSTEKLGLAFSLFFLAMFFVFVVGIGRIALAGNNAGAAFSIWPDTGQTKCYDNENEIPCPAPGEPFYGQDAQYQGPQRSYTKLGQGGIELPDSATIADGWIMTRDNVTGLIWEIKTRNGSIHGRDNKYTWCNTDPNTNMGRKGRCENEQNTEEFIKDLNNSSFGGYNDWRLPTIKELSSLVLINRNRYDPAIEIDYFPNTRSSSWYWSSTSYVRDVALDDVWCVMFGEGGIRRWDKYLFSAYVRAVRSEQPVTSSSFQDNHDGTITDSTTGLMWQKCSMGQIYNPTNRCEGEVVRYTWKEALDLCENFDFAGYNDWRLPNRIELQSILDYSKFEPSLNTEYLFPDDESFNYWLFGEHWSSTSHVNSFGSAWLVSFYNGSIDSSPKYWSSSVRCVRGGLDELVGASALPLPHGAIVFNYQVEETTKRANDPANCKPMAFKVNNDILKLLVDLPPFDGAIDIYLGIYAPSICSDRILLIVNNGREISWLSMGLKTLLSNTLGNITQPISLYIKPENLPQGTYYFYLLAVPANDLSLANYYLWSTTYVKN